MMLAHGEGLVLLFGSFTVLWAVAAVAAALISERPSLPWLIVALLNIIVGGFFTAQVVWVSLETGFGDLIDFESLRMSLPLCAPLPCGLFSLMRWFKKRRQLAPR
jgi:hypothetical protein